MGSKPRPGLSSQETILISFLLLFMAVSNPYSLWLSLYSVTLPRALLTWECVFRTSSRAFDQGPGLLVVFCLVFCSTCSFLFSGLLPGVFSLFLFWLVLVLQFCPRSPKVSPRCCFACGVKFPQGEASVVIHGKDNYNNNKDETTRGKQRSFMFI